MNDTQNDAVQQLEQQRRDLWRQVTRMTKDVGNAKKRQKRLLDKAGSLSDLQLMSVITSRAAKAKAKGQAKAKAKG